MFLLSPLLPSSCISPVPFVPTRGLYSHRSPTPLALGGALGESLPSLPSSLPCSLTECSDSLTLPHSDRFATVGNPGKQCWSKDKNTRYTCETGSRHHSIQSLVQLLQRALRAELEGCSKVHAAAVHTAVPVCSGLSCPQL